MKDLIKDTIGKIKNQHIKPDPKWKYLIRKYGIWVVFGIIILLGAMSFSVTYFVLASLDWDLYRFMHQNAFSYSLSIFPYFWAIVIAIFLGIAFFDIRRTETGYRFSRLKIAILTIGSIIVLGFAMSFVGLGERLNLKMTRNFPVYSQHMMVTKESQWMQPNRGFLSGTVVAVSNEEIKVDDLNKKSWSVQINEQTFIRPMADIAPGKMIKIIGTVGIGDNFSASEIRPWAGGRMGEGGQSCGGTSNTCSMMLKKIK